MLKIISAQRYYDPDAPGEVEDLPEENQIPGQELPVVGPENLGEYIDPEEDEDQIVEEPPPGFQAEETFLDEIPEVFEDDRDLIDEAINADQCIAFEYTTRNGNYAGWRLIEPYGTFVAGTGNELVVSWDRHRQNIRAFIINNIHPDTLKVMPGQFYGFVKDKFIFQPQ